MFFAFGKCPFLLRWKNVLFGSHALHQTSRQELPSRGKFNTIVYINTCKILIIEGFGSNFNREFVLKCAIR